MAQNMVTVVGAGPAGLAAATRLQERGWKTCVLEEHPVVGDPVACTGLISASGVRDLSVLKEVNDVLINRIKGAQIFSPNHEMIEIKRPDTVAYVVNRGEFDRVLAKNAVESGVDLRLNTRMIDIRNETVFVEHKGRGELVKSKVIVGADGPSSKTRKIMGIETAMENYVLAYQVVAKGNFDPNFVQLYLGSYAKDFFAWIVPESAQRARVGLATTSGNVRKDFNVFVNEKNIQGEFCDMCSKLIPIGEPLKTTVKDNLMLVGDAAFQTKATTGGGIMLGMEGGRICADSIHNNFTNGTPLKDYEKNCAELNKDLKMHWKIRQYINSKNEKQIDDLFRTMNKAKIGEFLSNYGDMDKPTRFVGKIMTKPSMWRLFPEAIKFLGT